jgi:cation:H+ antiporter
MLMTVLLFVLGLVLLIAGSELLVRGASRLAAALGVSPLVVGLTVVALGTSAPELAVCLQSALAGQADLAVGNVVGSNLLNILVVLGLSALAAPGGVPVPPGALAFDIPVMTTVAAACLPVFFVDGRIARWEGALFLAYYAAYTAYVLLNAGGAGGGHALLPGFRAAMTYFVLPLTAVTLLVLSARTARANRQGAR